MYIERDIESYFQKVSSLNKAIAVVGPRQSGKTTMLKNRINNEISYLLFDDIDIRTLFEKDIKGFQKKYLEGNEKTIMDEIHICKDAGINLKFLADTGNIIWMTSSSESLLGKDVLSYLVGRVSIVRLFPFSISELMRTKEYPSTTDLEKRRCIKELVAFGGYPDVALEPDPKMKEVLLRNLSETMVLKDISMVFNLKNISGLQRTIHYLSNIYTGILNFDNIARDLSISFKTLRIYLDAIEKSYIIRLVKPFFTNPNKELIKQPKVYFLDNGMRNVISGDIGMDIDGPSFENLIYSELLKMGYEPRYWRKKSGSEVDFVIQLGNEMIPIEVKISTHGNKVESGLRSFINLYSPSKAYIVYFEGAREEVVINDTKVIFLDLMELREDLEYLI